MAVIRRDLADVLTGRGRDVIAESPAWHEDALCAQVDYDTFFPEDGHSTRPAKKICAACPVLDACRSWALATDEQWGVWGGMSENDRRRARQTAKRELRSA